MSNSIGWVYIIKVGNEYKVGCTSNLPGRMGAYHNPVLISCRVVDNPRHYEAGIHRVLREKGKLLHGEWFSLTPDDVDWLKRDYFNRDATITLPDIKDERLTIPLEPEKLEKAIRRAGNRKRLVAIMRIAMRKWLEDSPDMHKPVWYTEEEIAVELGRTVSTAAS